VTNSRVRNWFSIRVHRCPSVVKAFCNCVDIALRKWEQLTRKSYVPTLALCDCVRHTLNMAEPTDSTPTRLEIKKYPNRRYYSTTHRRHLTLEEIRTLIQQGYDLKVTDAKTSADITAQVLTQIILELDTPKLDSLPVPLLMRLIRMNDQLVKDFIEKYFNQALKSFFDYQKQLEDQLRQAHGLPPVFPAVSAWTKAFLGPFASAFTAPGSETQAPVAPSTPPPAPAPAATPPSDLQALIRDLQQQVAELKQSRSDQPPPRRTRKKR
jgi:polyhydroxyalkanoate synthesis repressor PhaR